MRALALELWTSFVTRDGEVRELKNPEGSATPRQLRRLNDAGALVVVEPGQAQPIRMGEAAYAVSLLSEREPATDPATEGWRFH